MSAGAPRKPVTSTGIAHERQQCKQFSLTHAMPPPCCAVLCCADRKRRARAPAVKASPLTPTAAVKDEASKREFMVGGGCTGSRVLGLTLWTQPGVDWVLGIWGIWTAAS